MIEKAQNAWIQIRCKQKCFKRAQVLKNLVVILKLNKKRQMLESNTVKSCLNCFRREGSIWNSICNHSYDIFYHDKNFSKSLCCILEPRSVDIQLMLFWTHNVFCQDHDETLKQQINSCGITSLLLSYFTFGNACLPLPQNSTFLKSNSIGNSRVTGLSVEDCYVLPLLNKVDNIDTSVLLENKPVVTFIWIYTRPIFHIYLALSIMFKGLSDGNQGRKEVKLNEPDIKSRTKENRNAKYGKLKKKLHVT